MAIEANERFQDVLARTLQQFFRVTHVDEATRDDIGTCERLPGLFIDGEHGHQYTVLGQDLAVTQHDLSYVADAKAVDEDVATHSMVGYFNGVRRDFNDITILGQDYMFGRDKQRV